MRNEVLEKYADIIFKAENRSYTIKKDIEIFKAKILLRDGSTLRVSEKWIDETDNILRGYLCFLLDLCWARYLCYGVLFNNCHQ